MTAPVAPTLDVVINEGHLEISISGDILTGDTEFIRFGTDSTLAGYSQASDTVTDDALLDFGIGANSLATGRWYFEALTQRGADLSNPSEIVGVDIVNSASQTTGVASGVGTAGGTGAKIAAAAASASAVGVATAAVEPAGLANGVGAALAIGAKIAASVSVASAIGTASGAGATVTKATASASGLGEAVGAIPLFSGVAAGIGTAAGDATQIVEATASAVGIGDAAGAADDSYGLADGIGTAIADGAQIAAADSIADGAGDASAVGLQALLSAGDALGLGTALGIGAIIITPIPTTGSGKVTGKGHPKVKISSSVQVHGVRASVSVRQRSAATTLN